MNIEDLMQSLAIVLLILTLLKIDINEMMSITSKELISLAFVFITVMYLPFPSNGLFAMAFCVWYLAPFSWLKAKINENMQRKEAYWKRQEKKKRKKKKEGNMLRRIQYAGI